MVVLRDLYSEVIRHSSPIENIPHQRSILAVKRLVNLDQKLLEICLDSVITADSFF